MNASPGQNKDSDPKDSDPEVAEIVKRLDSDDPDARRSARDSLQQMGPEAVDALLAVLKDESRRWRQRRRIYTVVVIAYGLIFLLITGYGLADASTPPQRYSYLLTALACLGFALRAHLIARLRSRAAKLLATFHDKRAVGPLVDALWLDDPDARALAQDGLIHLLPRLDSADAHLLDATRQNVLCSLLKGKDLRMIGAILKAFEQVGGGDVLPAVERLAAGKGWGRRSRAVREAAQACLPFLQARAEKERDRQTLLRPAEGPDTPATLLRPAPVGSEEDQQILLRPGDPDEQTA